jgi:hypothetical protein
VDVGDDCISLDGYHAIDQLTVLAGGFSISGDLIYSTDVTYSLGESADVMIDDITVTAFEIRDLADEVLTDTDASLEIFGGSEDSSLQLRQSDIFVGADRYFNTANLEICGAWGTISSLTLEATYGGEVYVDINNNHNLDSSDVDYDHGLIARDVSVMAADEDAYAYLDLEIDNFIKTLSLQTLGYGSTVAVEIDQAKYGGLVSVSGTVLSDDLDLNCFTEVGSNEVNLTYWDETAEKIVIDNDGRTVNRFEDNSIEFNLSLFGEDNDLLTNVFKTKLTIEGWTGNDFISFSDIGSDSDSSGDCGCPMESDPVDLPPVGGSEPPKPDLITGDGVRFIYQSYTGTPLLDLTEENLDKLLTNARNAFNPTRDATDGGEIPGVNFYFGTAGKNGYLFYDYDGVGVTGVVELLGVTEFDYNWIDFTGYKLA